MLNIAIIGGGSAGWMTAAMLSHQLNPELVNLTVVDANTGGLGVGEATIPSIHRLLRSLNADEAEFMRSCSATWKLGIEFRDWVRSGQSNWHPFGVCGARLDQRDLFLYWVASRADSSSRGNPSDGPPAAGPPAAGPPGARRPQGCRPYHSYSLHWAASLAGKCPHATAANSPISQTRSYAYHLDAGRLSEWLKSKALSAGVRHLVAVMRSVQRDAAGNVSAIVTSQDQQVPADLFIDCTGFQGTLLQQAQLSDWISWNDQLLCDSAVAIRRPGNKQVPPYTTSTAVNAGWVWDIALAEQRGVGYVYSSRFASRDDALQELKRHAGVASSEDADPRFLKMKIGRQKNVWQKNVVAIGLSAGFVEPLESSGLHLVQVGIERLIESLTPNVIQPVLRTTYNENMSRVFDEVKDFIVLHYLLNQRSEPFWQAAGNVRLSDDLQHRLDLYDQTGLLPNLSPEAFPDASYYHLLAGCGRLPQHVPLFAVNADPQQVDYAKKSIIQMNGDLLRRLPLHEEGLKQIHTSKLAKAS